MRLLHLDISSLSSAISNIVVLHLSSGGDAMEYEVEYRASVFLAVQSYYNEGTSRNF